MNNLKKHTRLHHSDDVEQKWMHTKVEACIWNQLAVLPSGDHRTWISDKTCYGRLVSSAFVVWSSQLRTCHRNRDLPLV